LINSILTDNYKQLFFFDLHLETEFVCDRLVKLDMLSCTWKQLSEHVDHVQAETFWVEAFRRIRLVPTHKQLDPTADEHAAARAVLLLGCLCGIVFKF
jgi:hypothetical protein